MSAAAALGSILYIKNKPLSLRISEQGYDKLFATELAQGKIGTDRGNIQLDRKGIYKYEERYKNKRAAQKYDMDKVKKFGETGSSLFKDISKEVDARIADNQKMLDANKIKFKLGSDLTTARARSTEALNILNQNIRDLDYSLNQEKDIVRKLVGTVQGSFNAQASSTKAIKSALNDQNETNKAVTEKWAKQNKKNERKEKVKKAFTVDAGSVKD